jgi:hypothetical protein
MSTVTPVTEASTSFGYYAGEGNKKVFLPQPLRAESLARRVSRIRITTCE